MSNFVTLWASMFSVLQDFLLSEPIIWFVGLFVLFMLVALLYKVFNITK